MKKKRTSKGKFMLRQQEEKIVNKTIRAIKHRLYLQGKMAFDFKLKDIKKKRKKVEL